MSFNAIRENKILANISEFTVQYSLKLLGHSKVANNMSHQISHFAFACFYSPTYKNRTDVGRAGVDRGWGWGCAL